MKNNLKKGFFAALMGTAMMFTGCTDTESIIDDGTTQYDGTIEITEGAGDSSIQVFEEDVTGNEIKVLVKLTSTDKNLRRVYITKNVAGAGEVPYSLEGEGFENNGDGSLNLDAGNSFNFELVVPKNSALTGGTEEYRIWATNGKGDYRNVENSFVAGVGTVKIIYGAGTNPAAPVKEFTQTILAAPLGSGASKTFMSTVNGKTYDFAKVEGAAPDTAQFWDLGYYYGNTQKASLASAFNYPTDIVDISEVSGIPADQLNKCYFAVSDKTSEQFDAIELRSELDYIQASNSQRTTDLSAGDIIEFVDGYGKKGLIRVASIVAGFGTDAKITIDVKVQR